MSFVTGAAGIRAPWRTRLGEYAGDLGFTTHDAAPGADPRQRRWVVAHVRPKSPAALAVDGQDVQGANRYLFPALTQAPARTTLTLGLARGASVQLTVGARP